MSETNPIVPVETKEPVATPSVPIAPKEQTPTESSLALFARKERSLRQQANKNAEERKALEEMKAQFKPDVSWKDRIKTDLAGMLAEAGLSHENVTQTLVDNSPSSLSERKLQAQVDALREELSGYKTQNDDTQKRAYNNAVEQMRGDAKTLISSDSEKYEFLKNTDPEGDRVIELIETTYKEDGVVLSVQDAAQQVEDYLAEYAVNLAKMEKTKKLLTPKVEETKAETPSGQEEGKHIVTPQPGKQQIIPKRQQTNTLQNRMTVSAQTSATAHERTQRAIMAFKGQLK